MKKHTYSITAMIAAVSAAVLTMAPGVALAQLSDKPVRMVQDVAALLTAMGIGVFTCATLYAAYQMVFEGATFRSVKNIFWGGVLAGSVAAIAAWAMSA
jgi:type IV secretion system protein VirB2